MACNTLKNATEHFKKHDGTKFNSDIIGISCEYWDKKNK